MNELSDKKKSILIFIEKTIRERGYSPSVREIGDHVGLSSSSTVHKHIQTLIEMGYLIKDNHSPRTLRMVSGSSPQTNLLEQMRSMDDDVTDIVFLEGEPFVVRRATLEDIKEWSGADQ
ncbi:LexA family transcriptional regulator [Halobacillus sp. BBL2006]|uniref:LexA family protein n=1 Tax=Halobacillus sp. BBL2006 TaxID=1543706 RepID=UPI00068EB9AC|nr:helix-turn-helix domain-containing protein [Halobacillus sp. BBL2006]